MVGVKRCHGKNVEVRIQEKNRSLDIAKNTPEILPPHPIPPISYWDLSCLLPNYVRLIVLGPPAYFVIMYVL